MQEQNDGHPKVQADTTGPRDRGRPGAGALYVVATPIGNLEDFSLRAIATLRAVALIAAEDTRMSARLLDRHGITTRMLSLHEHNERRRAGEILSRLEQGEDVALISDAGTPAVSDPGALLVAEVHAAGYRVIPVPGASALIAALSVSGFPGPFHFTGFLPERDAARRKVIASLARLDCTLAFYEAPHRVVECVADLAAGLPGEREIVIARELTKLFETVHRGPLAQAQSWLEADADRRRGEFVLLVSTGGTAAAGLSVDSDAVLKALLAELPLAQSVKLACTITGLRRGELYPRALELTGQKAVPDAP
jgi:16S rRNA (cytidine1402-2'-O)-methyltransferase